LPRNRLTCGLALWLQLCGIGREHATELGNAVPKAPFFFLKPTTSYVEEPGTIEIPPGADVHHEGAPACLCRQP